MQCVIYKGEKKSDSYLFIEKKDDFERVPEALLTMFGRLELVMTLEINAEMVLARADVGEVINHLQDEGFYLQLPPEDYIQTHGVGTALHIPTNRQ